MEAIMGYESKKSPVKTAQLAAAASDMLWPAKPGKKEPPITAIGVILYNCLNSPTTQVGKENNDIMNHCSESLA